MLYIEHLSTPFNLPRKSHVHVGMIVQISNACINNCLYQYITCANDDDITHYAYYSMPSAASPSATATGNTQSTSFPIFPVALGATGLVIGLLVVVMIMLVVCLHHSKIKARSLAKEKEGKHSNNHYTHYTYIHI